MVTVKDGVIIDEYYNDGYHEDSVFWLHSGTKSVTAALIGIAIDEGFIDGVDTKISEYFPQLEDSDDAQKQEITVRHLLEHTSGIRWPEWSGLMYRQFVQAENWEDFVLSQPMEAAPGGKFSYSTGGSHLLAAILQQATGKTAYEFGAEHLFTPLGMDSVVWDTDPQGSPTAGTASA